MSRALSRELKEKARALGFSQVGIIEAAPGRRLDAYLHWIDQGHHGTMGYLSRPDRIQRRQNLERILPGVRSIVCVTMNHFPGELPEKIGADPSRGRISNYAWQADYHDVMTPRLKALAGWLTMESKEVVVSKVYVDTGAVMERDHAEQANLGFTGKNSMLIAPRRGSWHFLGELLTTLRLEHDEPQSPMPNCGSCRRCLDACPTDAFVAPYVLDSRRCISYLTIELKGWIPRELRPLMGNWVYGCDECQDVCPFNRFATQTDETAFLTPDVDSAAPPLVDLLALDEPQFLARYAHSPIKRIKRVRLVRNACVAAGNWGSPQAIPALTRLLSDSEPLLRGHAAWALRQIGGAVAMDALLQAYAREQDEVVRKELMA
jgi:epoxyqueuosine reductase